MKRLPTIVPSVYGSDEFASYRLSASTPKPTATISIPVRFAGRRQRHRGTGGRERRRAEEEPGAPGQAHAAKSAAIAAPDSSAFGTKPRAPQSPMQRP